MSIRSYLVVCGLCCGWTSLVNANDVWNKPLPDLQDEAKEQTLPLEGVGEPPAPEPDSGYHPHTPQLGSDYFSDDFSAHFGPYINCPSNWSAEFNTVFMKRRDLSSATLLVDQATGQDFFNANRFRFDHEFGLDTNLRRHLGYASEMELRFLWLDDQQSNQTFTSVDNVLLQTNPPTLFGGGFAGAIGQANFESEFYSGELNYRKMTSWPVAWLIGFRYAHLDDSLLMSLPNPGTGAGLQNIWGTENNLYGAQVGLDGTLWETCGGFRIEGVAKLGIYGNDIRSQFNSVGIGAATGIPAGRAQVLGEDHTADIAFLSELGFKMFVPITQQCSFTFGYQMLWIDGIAVSTDQAQHTPGYAFTANSTSNIPLITDSRAGAFYQGVGLGLEWVW